MKKKWLVALIATLSLTTCVGCSLPFGNTTDSESISATEEVKVAAVEKKTDDMVAIRVTEDTDEKLISVMKALQADGQLAFTQDAQGMITSIGGKKNAADWSSCWMLYTSDLEVSSTEFGTHDYNAATLGSAFLGADALPVKKGEVYIWVYTSF